MAYRKKKPTNIPITRSSSVTPKPFFVLFPLLVIAAILIYSLSAFLNFKRNTQQSNPFTTLDLSIKSQNTCLHSSPQSKPHLKNHSPTQSHNTSHSTAASSHERNHLDPYHNWNLFYADFQEMLTNLKIFVYPDIYNNNNSFAGIFLPHPNPYDPKLGNHFSEHMFKINLLQSPFLTSNAEEAHFFFLPFSINSLRNDPRVHSEASIADFVAIYAKNISGSSEFWNRSQGADHFYVCCHSVGRNAASKFLDLHRNAIQVVCSSSYYHKFHVAHKDVALPQVWPRSPETNWLPQHERTRLAFFAGRLQNSRIRQVLMSTWENDTSMDIFPGSLRDSYEEGFRKSKYCLHVKGYEVNTARISDAIHFGCVPVIISDHYDLPFANVLDWSKFSIIIHHDDVQNLKAILLAISEKMYARFLANLRQVRKHFQWHASPQDYDSFHMTVYQLWLRRGLQFSLLS